MANQTPQTETARLLVTCPDRAGIVATMAQLIYQQGYNILSSDQHSTDPYGGGQFFMRMVFDLTGKLDHKPELEKAIAEVAQTLQMRWQLNYSSHTKRMAILVSRYDHCLLDLLWRWQSGELNVAIPMVISNHADLRDKVEAFGLPYHHLPVTAETKAEQEAKILALLADKVDFIVLARYMQILSNNFVSHHPSRIINIHHSFLPAFIGANPFAMAYKRGVKMIGATAHYVTDDLDDGPIITQGVVQVTHRDSPQDMMRSSRDVERNVLAQAVRWHIEDRIIVHENKTIIFT